MAEFLLELYVARTNCAAVERGAESLGRSAAELSAEGHAIRVLRSLFVPEDETCYVLLEAATADAVREAARRAELPFERVVETTLDLGQR
jgi:Nickel responsive protein SCO4226-like